MVHCLSDRRFVHASAHLRPRETGVPSRNACHQHCRRTPHCSAFMYNRYSECYVLRADNTTVPDDPTHMTLACLLFNSSTPRRTWRDLGRLLRRPESFTQPAGERAFREAAHQLQGGSAPAATAGRLPFDVYVINLNASRDRLYDMQRQLLRVNVTWLRVPAIYGDEVLVDDLERQHFVEPGLHPRDVASALSHLQVWSAVASRGESGRAALVLEDDAILQERFVRKLREHWRPPRVERISAALPANVAQRPPVLRERCLPPRRRQCRAAQFDVCSLT